MSDVNLVVADGLGATAKYIKDASGNQSPLAIGTGSNVGIGTTSPNAKLNVAISGAGGAGTGLLVGPTSAGYGVEEWYDGNTGAVYFDSKYDNDNGSIFFRTKTAGTPINALTILGSGKVGLGTTSPSQKMHIYGGNLLVNNGVSPDTNSGLRLVAPISTSHYNWMIGAQENVDAGLEITPSTATGGTSFTTPVAVFKQNGKVGIGTTSPAEKLEVSGNIKASGTVAAGNEGLYWKIYTYTLTAGDSGLATISTSITASKIRGIQLSVYDSSLQNCYGDTWRHIDSSTHKWMYVEIGSGTISVYYDNDATYGFTTGDVVNVIVFYVP